MSTKHVRARPTPMGIQNLKLFKKINLKLWPDAQLFPQRPPLHTSEHFMRDTTYTHDRRLANRDVCLINKFKISSVFNFFSSPNEREFCSVRACSMLGIKWHRDAWNRMLFAPRRVWIAYSITVDLLRCTRLNKKQMRCSSPEAVKNQANSEK